MNGSRPFLSVGYIGMVVMTIAALIMIVSPPPSEAVGAHSSQIVTFEFVDTPYELQSFFSELCEGSTEGMTPEEHCAERKASTLD